jgi:hypothetical protein
VTGTEPVLALSSAYLASRALHVVADLGVADVLDDEPATTGALADALDADPDALGRVLRLLVDHGVFARDPRGRWTHTAASRLLRADHPASLRAFARMMGGPPMWDSLSALGDTVRTGRAGIRSITPDGFWAHVHAHPDQGAIFDEAMTDRAGADLAAVLASYDFSRHRRVADIGGGRGHLVSAVLASSPDATGVLFDLPHVLAALPAVTAATPRLEVVAGDFFADPLPVCDAYVLMQVVHDWDDTAAGAILAAVTRAAPEDATVLLLEWVLPEDGAGHPVTAMDVMMLATTGGRERTRSGYAALLDGAGIDLVAVHPTRGPMCVLEGRVRRPGAPGPARPDLVIESPRPPASR